MSIKSMMRSSSSLYSALTLVDFQAGQHVEAQLEGWRWFAASLKEYVRCQPRFAANQQAEFLDLGAREVKPQAT